MKNSHLRIFANGLSKYAHFCPAHGSEYDVNVACDEVKFNTGNYLRGIHLPLEKRLIKGIGKEEREFGFKMYNGHFFLLNSDKSRPDIVIQFSPSKEQIQYLMKTKNMPIEKPTDEEIMHFSGGLMADLITHVEAEKIFS